VTPVDPLQVYGARIRAWSKYVPRPPADAEKGGGAISSSSGSTRTAGSRRPSLIQEDGIGIDLGGSAVGATSAGDGRTAASRAALPLAEMKAVAARDEKGL
jgi:hypothetical protein